jgi:hypothetical protein
MVRLPKPLWGGSRSRELIIHFRFAFNLISCRFQMTFEKAQASCSSHNSELVHH